MNPENPSEFQEFERQLGTLEWTDPTPHWRTEILSRCAPPCLWFPTPLLIGVGTCWAVALGFWLATPEIDPPATSQPGRFEEWQRPSPPVEVGENLLGYRNP